MSLCHYHCHYYCSISHCFFFCQSLFFCHVLVLSIWYYSFDINPIVLYSFLKVVISLYYFFIYRIKICKGTNGTIKWIRFLRLQLIFARFLDATMHHYERLCQSVCWSLRPSVHLSICLSIRLRVHPLIHILVRYHSRITKNVISYACSNDDKDKIESKHEKNISKYPNDIINNDAGSDNEVVTS